jgi:hypothetical protein
MEIVEFKRELDEYIHEVEGSNNERSRAFYFLKFIQKVFNKGSSPELEKYVKSENVVLIRGRIDAKLGNLIIEFENKLTGNQIEVAKSQLKRYCTILWNNTGMVDYLCIATDGFNFMIYRPRSKKTTEFHVPDIILEQVDKFDLRVENPITV